MKLNPKASPKTPQRKRCPSELGPNRAIHMWRVIVAKRIKKPTSPPETGRSSFVSQILAKEASEEPESTGSSEAQG